MVGTRPMVLDGFLALHCIGYPYMPSSGEPDSLGQGTRDKGLAFGAGVHVQVYDSAHGTWARCSTFREPRQDVMALQCCCCSFVVLLC